MHHLNEIQRLNALAAADALYPRLPAERPRLHPLVRDSIASIEQGRPLSEIVAERVAVTTIDGIEYPVLRDSKQGD